MKKIKVRLEFQNDSIENRTLTFQDLRFLPSLGDDVRLDSQEFKVTRSIQHIEDESCDFTLVLSDTP